MKGASASCLKHLNCGLLPVVFLICLQGLGCGQAGQGISPGRPSEGNAPFQSRQQAQTIHGRVVAIADGDTLTVLDARNTEHRIRLQGIDAPERTQAFGTRSRAALATLVFNQQVTVEYSSRDRYGRVLGKILVEGVDANLAQIRAGLAWVYRQYADQLSAADRTAYEQAEREAREARRGLWADQNPTPPWDYRRAGREGNNIGAGARPEGQPSTITNANTVPTNSATNQIIGNRRSRIYHEPNCPNFRDVSEGNRVIFSTREEAERAGYRRARNCP